MTFCDNCFKGVTHEGTPTGKWEKIGGVDVYVATPSKEYDKTKAILFLSDVFGPQFINNQLLADDFAANGFRTFIPDYFNGDPIPADAVVDGALKFDIASWRLNHGPDKTRPPLDKVISALKEQHGVTTFGATGFCFGGRYVFDLAFENIIKVAVVSHPSMLQIPADLEKYATVATAPLLINSCETDAAFPQEACAQADALLAEAKFAPGYKREHFPGCAHGFAVRGDMTDERVRAGKEGAFRASVVWFAERL
ncbi:Hydrolase tropI [Psilocybe cubensis]|uniref:Hydrolase tropI n=2 Tax=Psilocybe cubensis TaxID=181762 RepID=A0ACB8H633_PSICU|nr:Hydrolase tropI [Psilocybe cubensis]KAH9483294.1 Hydrolase tropI [Psilocybe cubensis]